MSAFMVTENHIHALVQMALYGTTDRDTMASNWYVLGIPGIGRLDAENAGQLGEMLTIQNLKSIHARYPNSVKAPETTPGPHEHYWGHPYAFKGEHKPRFTGVECLKLINCYTYQACEDEGWETSHAALFCRHLSEQIVSVLPGYDDAAWDLY